MNIQQQTQTTSYEQQLSKTQNLIIAKACLIGGGAFAIICGLAFGFYQLALSQNISFNTLSIIGVVFLLITIGMTFVVSFKQNLSGGMIGLLYVVYMIAISVSFASLFALFDGQTLLMAFGATAGALLLTGIVGFLIKDKTAFKLARIIMIMFFCYFIFMVSTMLLMAFTWGISTWYFYLVYAFMGVIIFGSNVLTFYNLRKTSQFLALSEMDKNSLNKFIWLQGFNILVSIVNTFIYILRIILMFTRN